MQAARVSVRVHTHDARRCLVVSGAVPPERMAVLPSELVGHTELCQPTAGRFEQHDGDVLFVPRFPLVGGLSYSLLIDGAEAATVEVPGSASTPTTRVVSIRPTAVEIPVNLLRLYVSFSAQMAEGFAAGGVQARRVGTGTLLDDVFLPTDTELWDGKRQRLTLLFDPGRIKRGLVPHAEDGYPLVEGGQIVLTVGRSMRDAAGAPLRAGGGRLYRVGPAIRARVDPHAWEIKAPAAGSTDALIVSFDRPLDYVLLGRCLEVRRGAAAVPGKAVIEEGERRWRFEPEEPWSAGSHELCVDAVLEDLAGNSVARVFDRELDLAEHAPFDDPRVDVPFVVS
jgi:hypothetical protein